MGKEESKKGISKKEMRVIETTLIQFITPTFD